MVHYLKIRSDYFDSVLNHTKSFEVRFNDRNYQVGDSVVLNEFVNGHCTGKFIRVKITYILSDFIGLKDGYVCFSFIPDGEILQKV